MLVERTSQHTDTTGDESIGADREEPREKRKKKRHNFQLQWLRQVILDLLRGLRNLRLSLLNCPLKAKNLKPVGTGGSHKTLNLSLLLFRG